MLAVAGVFSTPAAAAQPAPPTATTTWFAAWSTTPLPAEFPQSSIPMLDANPNAGVQMINPGQPVVMAVDTPTGYIRITRTKGKTTDYLYQSDYVYQSIGPCQNGVCTATDTVQTYIKESVTGGSSKNWTMYVGMRNWLDTTATTWSSSVTYFCGVSVPGGRDYICEGGGASASNVAMNVNQNTVKTFPSTSGKIVFPMLSVSTLWTNGVVVTTKFRGWDVSVGTSSSKLAATSGDGY